MPAKRTRVALTLVVLPASLLLLVFLGSACSEAKLVAAGGECLQATDCDNGLVCIPQGGKRVCSSDLSRIEKTDNGGGGDDAAEAVDGAPTESDAPGTITDAPARDTNSPRDTSVPTDTQPPQDTGAG